MSATQTRPCPTCGQPFTWSTASPRQRFCSPRCKAAWWRAVSRGQPATGGGPSHGAVTAVQACPHCHQPVAVITWLVTPAAAYVNTPPRHAVTVRDNP